MNVSKFAYALAVAAFVASPAFAVDVVNEDAVEHTVTAIVNDKKVEIKIPAGKYSNGICDECKLSLPTGATIDAGEDAVVLIKGGKFSLHKES